ncbi:DUF4437 domain-containing protein [Acaryochloris marina]|uniref:DUF4437 domain-containing protein n=1 Tax=Acaryochloris marina (strain MBIC 11017) TaxID=329726 RepID=B0CA55_ACAM1|nr:DUF4437 domain-containing protein [Acaryochloris marina]ABW26642.1 conserved hypothetical protein [Acaryochloris marina MBIC11017]BDM81431.1 hypothetical protein AM10699_42980 [Acaryochloris marina MBIC10699]
MLNIRNIKTVLILALAFFITVLGNTMVSSQSLAPKPKATAEILLMSDVQWGPLNPARGDKSPKAGQLWGDRTGSGPSGFLVEFVDGFSSPPHIHNVTYKGMVIQGLLHNDDPDANKMWLPAGSFWTQPAGEVHVTAADDSNNLAYIEIEEGPYLVRPPEAAFDNGERPVNVDKSNLVWLNASNITWVDQPEMLAGAKMAFLWGNPQDGQLNGTLIKLPTGFTGEIQSQSSTFRAVVIQGQPSLHSGQTSALEPGSYFGSQGETVHKVSCEAKEECVIYVRAQGKYNVVSS